MSKTMFDKIWDQHVITGKPGDPQLIYVDLHLLHEVTSPQAFEGLRENHRKVRRTDKTFATMDHNVPTVDIFNIQDAIARKQIDTLQKNTDEFGIRSAGMGDEDQGIIHVIGPQLGLTQPGMVIVCGDSHTATHGAFGSIAFGIGTSEVEHVLATQTIWQTKPKTMGIHVHGKLHHGVYAKDIIMGIIAREGVAFGTGYAAEFYGDTISNMSMEERMTLCNMAIEGGAKMGSVQPDQTTFDYVAGRKYAPKQIDKAIEYWKQFTTDDEAAFDKVIDFDVSDLSPYISWGTNPGMSIPVNGRFPEIKDEDDRKAYEYVGLKPGGKPEEIPIRWAFFGSCTNGRLSDLKIAASVLKGHHIAEGLTAWVVPGSRTIKERAEELGIDQIFKDAGCEWREPGCSACLGMNPDHVPAGIHCASTSNRNFEGRQGVGSRTHLASPAMVAAAAINGHFIDISKERV
ncbi:3-isopropylmalate dehydratase large subunit [Lentilactobacillus parabuchneri]|uniref:3-isopropylmalate dehydratase large subunit n=2 Tax=Lentilactobacillus parabuchneri TaxID=152331 RepID=A0A1X1FF71_9LACO|nr:3-isopropylmalate dehydratase large subunit [Lentilactobacillus parabuchneri]APR07314.1 3-isopropylmalate dehydratase large subunit [Lentilactobacillus parabuchneri]MBW0223047.1 3-isopropylmalate dehydratase large subunit [Lentilactobacillus parabuchneri]MBW0245356.1 3-isopropylmalate dehydratase large subunit [Lentilactobacillus parabuchneri]MBW0263883.1 3-isopropylmalate dehydratase large subunit [Lentilactobacillus parabuchneri]MCT2884556.1 3-isopropylmalate dehydratase large subunit [Le